MPLDEELERLTITQSQWQRGNHNPIQYANTAKHEGRKTVARVAEQTNRIEEMTR